MHHPPPEYPYATDAWLALCLGGVGGHMLFASSVILAWVPPILQDATAWMAIVGLLGLVLRAWEGHKAHSRTIVSRDAQIAERDTRLADRDARIADLGTRLAEIQGSLGRCEMLVEFYQGHCKAETCPIRDAARAHG